ncbi:MAG: hemin uptake protein HemP [Thiomicrospira sp.]|uniref:hemin uptake protein HemP n=1 Tax=Thiomicrospira sp. TaxID=935 RepID=UPI0019F22A0A|nr:hemin uptake protein HemP [Thiomicrospira sp.]MBE0493508.1 hemin uptake protein HemP [Thiomicrospira sp.]
MSSSQPANESANTKANASSRVRTLDSQSILAGQTQVRIQHGDIQYRLCLTKENKLILTK